MEIILKQDVKNLGYTDDVVKVRDGYGANFLIPQGQAILATESAKKVHAENLRQRAGKETKIREQAAKTAEALKDVTLQIGTKAGDSGKIFGSVNTIQIAEALKKAGLEMSDIDLFEINEAFAVVPMRFMEMAGVSHDRVNVNGGAIALGHPLGATGSMILGTLLDELERTDKKLGLASLCVGGGMGIATIIERV